MKTLPRNPLMLRAAAAASRVFPGLAEKDRGAGGHDAYFAGLQGALKRAGVAQPTLVVDRERLAANIGAVRRALAPPGLALRVVTKSLPAPALLTAVIEGTDTGRLMVFNGVMLDEMTAFRPQADVLLGRPLPAAQVADFVRRHASNPAPAARPQWLADSAARLASSTPRSPGPRLRRCGSISNSMSASIAADFRLWRRSRRLWIWRMPSPSSRSRV